jgi:hypothetical protein
VVAINWLRKCLSCTCFWDDPSDLQDGINSAPSCTCVNTVALTVNTTTADILALIAVTALTVPFLAATKDFFLKSPDLILVNNQLDVHFQCIYLFHFSACFEKPSAHHQENQFYQYIIWYISLRTGIPDSHLHRVIHTR